MKPVHPFWLALITLASIGLLSAIETNPILRVLEQTVIPEMILKDTEFKDAFDFLAYKSIENSPSQPGGVSFLMQNLYPEEKKGIPPGVIFDDNPGAAAGAENTRYPKVTYHARNVSLLQAMKELAPLYKVDFHVTSVGIVVTAPRLSPFPNAKAEKGEILRTYPAKKS